jgi:hypothetical protein
VSKRVNIQRLKTDIWGNIRSALPAADQDHDGHDTESALPSPARTSSAVCRPGTERRYPSKA